MTDHGEDRCRFFFCDEPHYARGWCAKHYQNLRRYDHAISPNQTDLMNVLERLREVCTVLDVITAQPIMFMDVDDHSNMVRCRMCGRMSLLADVDRMPLEQLHNNDCMVLVGRGILAATPIPPANQI